SEPSVLRLSDSSWVMYYTVADSRNSGPAIGRATSTDGVVWMKTGDSPVLRGEEGEWDDMGVLEPSVLFDGTTYQMWYAVNDLLLRPGMIGRATSTDGIAWTKSAGPVLTKGE